jgi:hypothetical protein
MRGDLKTYRQLDEAMGTFDIRGQQRRLVRQLHQSLARRIHASAAKQPPETYHEGLRHWPGHEAENWP